MKDTQPFPHLKVLKSSKTRQSITLLPPESEESVNKSRDGHKGRKGIVPAKLGNEKGLQSPSQTHKLE